MNLNNLTQNQIERIQYEMMLSKLPIELIYKLMPQLFKEKEVRVLIEETKPNSTLDQLKSLDSYSLDYPIENNGWA